MPGTVRSIIIGGGLAAGTPSTLGTVPIFSGATPPDVLIDSTLVQTSATLITQGGAFRFGNAVEARRWTIDTPDASQGGFIASISGRSIFSGSAAYNGGVFIGSVSLGTVPTSAFANVVIGSFADLGSTTGKVITLVGEGISNSGTGSKFVALGRNLVNNSGSGVVLIGMDISTSGAISDVIAIKAEMGSSTMTIGHSDCISIGGASSSAANQCLMGGGSILIHEFIFGQGTTGAGTVVTTAKTFHPTDAAGANTTTSTFSIRGMRPTGNAAASGNLVLEGFTPVGAGSTQQTIVPVLTIQQTTGGAGQAGVRFDTVTSGAGALAGTLLNAPVAGDPTFWLPVDIAGTVRHIPCW